MTFKLIGHPAPTAFLDLPWHLPLAAWPADRVVPVTRGISRHVVRFISADGVLYALKELPEEPAVREYRLLRQLAARQLRVVSAVGAVTGRTSLGDGEPLDAVLITRHLEFSLPYRTLFGRRGIADLRRSLLQALAELLVQLHLAGFFWGDCSLSNTLFRRDAGSLAAYLVDAETGELHPTISDRMREYDLAIAEENIAGELLDLEAALGSLPGIDPFATARELRGCYESLWSELTREEVFRPGERYRLEARLRRINELGFDAKEIELVATAGGERLRLQTQLVEPGHHRRRLLRLTGLDVQENQARRLLNDLMSYRAHLEQAEGHSIPEAVAASRWLVEVFEPALALIPPELRNKLEPAELYHQILDHRWFLSQAAGQDVGMEQAVRSYVAHVLRFVPDERTVLGVPEPEPDAAEG
ncbi:MAG: DUF4032 domain-containing protein [Sphaerobacter sp.]|nr:DUF4032 domain-containing protein [Sphaerobacter sp.]